MRFGINLQQTAGACLSFFCRVARSAGFQRRGLLPSCQSGGTSLPDLVFGSRSAELSKASSLCTTCMHMKTTHRTSELCKATPYPSTLLVARLQERLGYCHVDSELSTAGRRPKSQEACKLVLLSSLRPRVPKKEATSSWFDFGSSGGSLRRM